MSEMIERVAAAIEHALEENPPGDYYLNKVEHFRRLALAAIEAMREPTGEMVDALAKSINDTKNPAPTKTILAWYAMIDAARAS